MVHLRQNPVKGSVKKVPEEIFQGVLVAKALFPIFAPSSGPHSSTDRTAVS